MTTMKDYQVIEAYSTDRLRRRIHDAFTEGWVCQGGLAIERDNRGVIRFYQAKVLIVDQ